MKIFRMSKRLLAMLLTLALLIGALPASALAEDAGGDAAAQPAEAPSQTLTDSLDAVTDSMSEGGNVRRVVYHEVTFELPAGDTERDALTTQMQESTLVPDGTPVYELEVPKRPGCLFMGWYYDADLTQLAGEADAVEEDLVLYPRFEVQNGLDGEVDHRYIHAKDVGPDYQVVVSSFGLTREQAADLIRVRDLSEGDGDPEQDTSRPFTLADAPLPEKPLDLEALDLTEEQLKQVQIAIGEVEAGRMDGVALYDALVFLEVPLGASLAILAKYALDDIDEIVQALDQRAAEEREAALALAKELYPDSEIVFADDRNADEPEEENEVETANEAEPSETARFTVLPEGGAWTAGHEYQIEILDTARLRFIEEGEPARPSVLYSSFTVFRENVDTMRVDSSVIFIPVEQIEGIDPSVAPVNISVDDNGAVERPSEAGAQVLSYTGDVALAAGDVLAVYDGELMEDGIVDGDVTYVKIAGPLEDGKYAYVAPTMLEVLRLPEILPVPDDGSFEDGVIVLDAAAVDFSAPIYGQLKLNAKTTVDAGDYMAFYTGSLDALLAEDVVLDEQTAGFGRVTKVETADGKLTVAYEPVTFEDIDAEADFHMSDVPIDVSLSEEQSALLAMEIGQQVEESGFAEQAGHYIQALVMDEDLPQHLSEEEYNDVMRHAAFETEDGQPMTLEEVRLLSGVGQFVSLELDGTPSITIGDPSHFTGDSGVRVGVGIGCKITILLNTINDKRNQVVITGRFSGSQEVAYSYWADYWKEWKGIKLVDVKLQAVFTLKSYTSLGFTARVTLEQEPDEEETPWTKLKGAALGLLNNDGADKAHENALQLLDRMAQAAESAEQAGQFDEAMASALPDAYRGFITSASDYIKLYERNIFYYEVGLGLIGFVRFSISVDFVIRMRMTALLGLGVNYEVQRKFDITMWAIKRQWDKKSYYVKDPSFTLGFFAFGLIGVKAGVKADLRMGLIKTSWASVGLQAEVGAYFEAYGFFYYVYHKSKNAFDRLQGSLYYETGIYLTVDFHMQVGDDWKAKTWNLYNDKWPLLSGGTLNYPMDFSVPAGDQRLNVEITGGATSAKVNSDVFGIKTMDLVNGNTSTRSMDSTESYAHKSAISAAAQAYTQPYADAKYAEYENLVKNIPDPYMRQQVLSVAKKYIDSMLTATAGASADEKNFYVDIYDVDPATGNPTGEHSFRYDPRDNTVYVEPAANGPAERWGRLVFTYRNNVFGISTVTLKRTVNIHWKGELTEVPVNYVIVEVGQKAGQGTTLATETLSFIKGLGTKFTLTKNVLNRVPGARLVGANLLTTAILPSSFKKVNIVYAQSTDLGTVININPQSNETLSLQLIYEYNDVSVNWSLMSPGDDATPFVEAVTTTEKANKPIEQIVPVQLRSVIDGVEGYHVVWYQKQGAVMKRTDAVGPTDTELVGLFAPNEHTVSWVISPTNTKTQTVAYNAALTPPKASRKGRTFTRWKLDGKTLDPDMRMPDRDLTIEAGWKKNKYKVVWVIDGQMVAYTEVPYSTKLSEAYPEVTREHYTAVWKKQAKIENLSVNGASYTGKVKSRSRLSISFAMPDYDLYIEGIWQINKNTVTWLSQGCESVEQTVAYGEALHAPDPGSVEGHDFKGWIVRLKSGTEPFVDGMAMPDEPVTIEAVWEPVPCTVYFVTGATLRRSIQTIITTKRNRLGLRIPDFSTQWVYTLSGGTLEAQVEVPYGTSGIKLASYANVSREGHTVTWMRALPYEGTLEGTVSEDATFLGARSVPVGGLIVLGDWKANVHTITWQAEGEKPVIQKVSFGQTLPDAPAVNSREGYTLNPWMIGDDMLQPDMTVPDRDLTITADWRLNTHRVLWEVDYALVKEETVSYGAALTPPQVDPVEGHTLSAWTIEGEALAADQTMPDKDLIIRATMQPNPRTITWQAEGEEPVTQQVRYGQPLPNPPAFNRREGYTLGAWKIGDEPLQPGMTVPDADLTITAGWMLNAHQVVWEVDGEAVKEETVSYGAALAAPDVTPKAGHTLSAWTVDGAPLTDAAAMPDNDVTVKARWIPNQHTARWTVDGETVKEETLDYGAALVPPAPARAGYDLSAWSLEGGAALAQDATMPDSDLTVAATWIPRQAKDNWFLYDAEADQTTALAEAFEAQHGQPISDNLPQAVSQELDDVRYTHEIYSLQGSLTAEQALTQKDAWAKADAADAVPPGETTYVVTRAKRIVKVTWAYETGNVEQSVWVGDRLAPPTQPDKVGHRFDYWEDAEHQTHEYPPPQDVTLYPHFTPLDYTITWVSEDKVVRTDTLPYGTKLTPPALSRTGYTLAGWQTAFGPLPANAAVSAYDLTITADWQANTHQATWIVDGSTVGSGQVAYGTELYPPAVNVPKGHSLSGWVVNGAAYTPGMTMPDNDVTGTASITTNRYAIVWKSDGVMVGGGSVDYGAKLAPPQVTKEGHSLTGWTTEDGKKLPETMPDHPLTAVAVWKVNEYKLTWSVDQKAEKTQSVEYGAPVKAPNLTKKHYTLTPWMVNGAALPENYTMPASDTTVTASWVANSNTATWLDAKKGKTLKTLTIAFGQPIPTGPALDVKTGYTFKGWSIDGKLVTDKTTMPDEDITLLPEWEINSHMVFWTVDGEVVKKESVKYGEKLSPPKQTKQGHTLSDWMVNGSKLIGSFTMPDDSVTAVAGWKVNRHQLTWVTVDKKGENVVKSETVAYGTTLDAPHVDSRVGYELSDWKIGRKKIDKDTTMPDEDTVVKAEWEHNEHIWDEGSVTGQPTCKKEGKFTRKCTICGEEEDTKLPKDPSKHRETQKNAKKPTCSEEGHEADTYCKDCGVLLAEGKSIPKTNDHKWEWDDKATKPANCLSEGVRTRTCKKCGEIEETVLPIDPDHHEHTATVGAVPAGCVEPGYTGDVRCIDCGKTIEQGTAIDAKDHLWNKGTRRQVKTDTEPGLVVYSCQRCGQQKEEYDPVIPKLEGLYRGTVGAAPGVAASSARLEDIAQAARDQGATLLKDLDPALFFQAYVGSAPDDENRRTISASFSWHPESGEKNITQLRDGDVVLVVIEPEDEDKYAEELAPAVLFHTEHEWQYAAMLDTPTCTHPGSADQACAFCDAHRNVDLPVDPENHCGQTYLVDEKEATDTEPGYTGDTICADCGALLKAGEVIPPKGTTP